MDKHSSTATLLLCLSWTGSLFAKLGKKGLLSQQDGIDILEHALLNLETQQAIAGADSVSVAIARQQLDDMIKELRAP